MSNALTLNSEALKSEVEKKITALKRTGRVIIFALLLILLAGALNFAAPLMTASSVPVHNVVQAARWTLFGASTAASLGTIALLRMLSRLRAWHREFQKELLNRLNAGEKLWATTMRNQISDAR